jgi:hypothetical protein
MSVINTYRQQFLRARQHVSAGAERGFQQARTTITHVREHSGLVLGASLPFLMGAQHQAPAAYGCGLTALTLGYATAFLAGRPLYRRFMRNFAATPQGKPVQKLVLPNEDEVDSAILADDGTDELLAYNERKHLAEHSVSQATQILNVEKDDDCPPLALTIKLANGATVQIALVADGIGSAGWVIRNGTVFVDAKPAALQTRAPGLAARALKKIVHQLALNDPEIFLADTITLDKRLKDEIHAAYSQLLIDYRRVDDTQDISTFASTFSFALTTADPASGKMKTRLFCVGDSPVIIITPGEWYIHNVHNEKNITLAIGADADQPPDKIRIPKFFIYAVELPLGTPLIMIAMTDGLIYNKEGADALLKYLLMRGPIAHAEDLINWIRRWRGPHFWDDATIAVTMANANGLSVREILGADPLIVESKENG